MFQLVTTPTRRAAWETSGESVPTVLVGKDRLALEGLRSILRESRFRVVEGRSRVTETCLPFASRTATVLVLACGPGGLETAAGWARAIRRWNAAHRIIAVVEAVPPESDEDDIFDGYVWCDSVGEQMIEALARDHGEKVRAHVRTRFAQVQATG